MKKNPMACEEFVDSLAAFRDDELTSPDRIRAQEHLASCDKCSAYLRGYDRTIELAKRTGSDSRLRRACLIIWFVGSWQRSVDPGSAHRSWFSFVGCEPFCDSVLVKKERSIARRRTNRCAGAIGTLSF